MTLLTPDDMFLEKVSGPDEAKSGKFAMKVKWAGMPQTRASEPQAPDACTRVRVGCPYSSGTAAPWRAYRLVPCGEVQEYWHNAGQLTVLVRRTSLSGEDQL